jgi:hypothetical protein
VHVQPFIRYCTIMMLTFHQCPSTHPLSLMCPGRLWSRPQHAVVGSYGSVTCGDPSKPLSRT